MSDHQATAHELEAQHAAIQAEISANLKQGLPTLDARRKLAEVQSDLQVARSAASAQAAREQAEIAGSADAKGRTAAAGTIAGVGSLLDPFALPASPDLSRAHLHPAHVHAIESASGLLAVAEEKLAEAQRVHGNAEAEVRDLEQRLADIRERRATITQNRIGGKIIEAETAEFGALSGDADALRRLLEDCRQTAAGLSPSDATRAVADARKTLDRARAEARATLLVDHVELVSRTLESVLYGAEAAGRAVGRSLHLMWRPSPVLRHALSHGWLPTAPRHHGG
jgi:hypothetical protein